uniref:SSD domain-containing protein n=1 Tax=Panagrellus redivivus TaxID=6233 RepID=A0A7E4VJB4_PANRE
MHAALRLGGAVGRRPEVFLVLAVVIVLPGLYGAFFQLKTNLEIDEDFTPLDAPSRREIAYQKSFFGANESSYPWYLATFGRPRISTNNMMNDEEFAEFQAVYDYIVQNITFTGDDGKPWTYLNICEPFCGINSILTRAMTTTPWIVNRKYPVFDILIYKANIGKFIFKRTEDEHGTLIGSQLMAFYFMHFVHSPARKAQLEELDGKVFKYIQSHNANGRNKVEIFIHGTHRVASEVMRGFEETVPRVSVGLILGLSVFALTLILAAQGFRQCGIPTLLLVFIGIMITVISILTAIGTVCLFGYKVNVIMAMTPFIAISFILNVTVLYQITDIWYRVGAEINKKTQIVVLDTLKRGKASTNPLLTSKIYRVNKAERTGYLFQQIASSFFTNLTVTVLAFGAASIVAITNFQSALLIFALIVFYTSVLQLFFFCPILALTCNCVPETVTDLHGAAHNRIRSPPLGQQVWKAIKTCFVAPYARFLRTSLGKISFVTIFCLGYVWSASYGMRHLQNEMDFKRLVPKDSPSIVAFNYMDNHIWNDFLQFVFIVNKPPNFTASSEYLPFREMVSEIEQLPSAYGPKTNMMWLIDYLFIENGTDYHTDQSKQIDMSKFKSFITEEPYSAWNDGLDYHIDENGRPVIDRMIFMVTFKGINKLSGKVKVLSECRKILKRYPQFDTASFDTDSGTVDMILALPRAMATPALAEIVLTALLSVIFMQNFVAALATTFFTATNIVGVHSFVYLFNVNIDIFDAGSFLFSALIGNFMVTQAVSEFMRQKGAKHRLQVTVERLTYHNIKILAISSVLLVPILFSNVPVHFINALVVVIAVIIGVVHSLYFVPAALNMIPASYTGDACCSEASEPDPEPEVPPNDAA